MAEMAAISGGMSGVKGLLDIGSASANLAKSSYEAQEAKERLHQMAKPHFILTIRIKNTTPYTWSMPQAYFKHGLTSVCPPLLVEPNDVAEWTVNSQVRGSIVEGTLRYDVEPMDTVCFAMMFRVSGDNFCFGCCSSGAQQNIWSGEVVRITDNFEFGKKRKVKNLVYMPTLHEYLQDKRRVRDGNCCTTVQRSGDYEVYGIMAPSQTPEMLVHVMHKSCPPQERQSQEPAPPLPTHRRSSDAQINRRDSALDVPSEISPPRRDSSALDAPLLGPAQMQPRFGMATVHQQGNPVRMSSTAGGGSMAMVPEMLQMTSYNVN